MCLNGCVGQFKPKQDARLLGLRGEEVGQFLHGAAKVRRSSVELQSTCVAKKVVQHVAQSGGFARKRIDAPHHAVAIAVCERRVENLLAQQLRV